MKHGQHLREAADDFREWEDTPTHVRERCLEAERRLARIAGMTDGRTLNGAAPAVVYFGRSIHAIACGERAFVPEETP